MTFCSFYVSSEHWRETASPVRWNTDRSSWIRSTQRHKIWQVLSRALTAFDCVTRVWYLCWLRLLAHGMPAVVRSHGFDSCWYATGLSNSLDIIFSSFADFCLLTIRKATGWFVPLFRQVVCRPVPAGVVLWRRVVSRRRGALPRVWQARQTG